MEIVTGINTIIKLFKKKNIFYPQLKKFLFGNVTANR